MFLEEDLFLSKLTLMFEKSRTEKGTVRLTFKRYDGRDKPRPKTAPSKFADESVQRKLIVRATLGNHQKISTVVHPEKVAKFQDAYCKLLRNNMDGLKKEKKKKKAAKTATKA